MYMKSMKGLTIDGHNTSYPFKVKSRKEARMNDNIHNFIIIHPVVLQDERLNFTEKAVYGLLFGLSRKEGYAFASNEYISGIINVEIRTVQRVLERLENFEFIKRHHDDSGNRRIYINPTPWGVTNLSGGDDKNVIHIIKNINIDNISKDILSVEGETQLVDIEEVLERTTPEKPAKTKVNKKISHLERYANSLVLEKILERAKITTYPMALKQQRVFGNLIRKRIWDALPEQDRTPDRVIVEIEKVCDSFGKDQYHFKNMGDLRFYYYKMVLHSPLFAKTTKKEVYL